MGIVDAQIVVKTSPAKQIALLGPNLKSNYVSGEEVSQALFPIDKIKGRPHWSQRLGQIDVAEKPCRSASSR